MPELTPCLWFDDKAEEAANFYVSIFSSAPGRSSSGTGSRIVNVVRYGDEGAKASGKPKGTAMTVTFELDGQKFVGLNGGPVFKFSPAISFVVNCETQEQVDRFWDALSEGGGPGQCGWLQDKYGVSWQIFPIVLGEMLQDPDARKSERVMKAMLQMNKLDIGLLKQAYDQG